jgi:hypothetical protein
MKPSKICFIIALITLLCLPYWSLEAQNQEVANENNTETVQQTDGTEFVIKEKKKDKKKNSEIKELKINETFYFNLLIDIITVLILILGIYYRKSRNKDLFFTYFVFNIAIFLLTFLLNQVKMSMGAAFGLFAVFSMLRYRTEGISVKDMTYLFIVIAIGLISAIQLEYYELGIIDGILILATFILDGGIFVKQELFRKIQYEKIELIKVQNYDKLIEDLRERTGLNIHRVSINKMDFLKDSASINAYYFADKNVKTITESGIPDTEI